MKRFFIFVLILISLALISTSAYATNIDVYSTETIYLEDGSYIVTTISTKEISRSSVKTIQKNVSCYESDGTKLATLTVTSVFNVSNNSVTCTSSTYSTKIYEDGWGIYSASATYSNNGSNATATATGTAKKKVLGITTKSIPLSVTITCYSDGSYS